MNKSTRQFVEMHFGVTVPRLGVPRSVRRRANGIDTIIIDSSALSDGALIFAQAYGVDTDAHSIIDMAHRALVGNTADRSQLIRTGLPHFTAPPYDPVTSHEGKLTHSSWHHGESFQTYWIGEVTDIIHYADLTENEREQFAHTAHKFATQGRHVYAVGYSKTSQPPKAAPAADSLTSIGLIAFHITLHPETVLALEELRTVGIRVVYASCDSPSAATTLAHLACLVPSTILAKDASRTVASTRDNLVAGFSLADRIRFCQRFNPETTLFVTDPIAPVWHHLSALRLR